MTTSARLQGSAQRFSLASIDQNIGAWIRKYAEPSATEWTVAENALMRTLLDLAIIPPEDLMPADGEADAVANALARALGNCDRDASYSTDYLVALSALAFAAAGNFPSASVFARRARRNTDPGPAERWMMRVLARPLLNLSEAEPPYGFVSYAQLADRALESGLQEDFIRAETALRDACRNAFEATAQTDRYLLLFWQQIHRRFEELSAARLLRQLGFRNQAYISELVNHSSCLFYPSQARTLREQPLIQPGERVLLNLRPGTGKSLLGEITLVSSLTWDPSSRWLAVYLAPYRALTDQLQKRMRNRLRRIDIKCVIRRGGYLSDKSTIDAQLPTILIATPEAFDALLRQRPELYASLAACVFDEFHLIEQQERGLRYEGLIGRMLRGAAGEGWPKIVALSAVSRDTARVTQWLQMEKRNVAELPWRPTAHRLAITDPEGNINYYAPADMLANTTDPEEIAWSGALVLPHRNLRRPVLPYSSNRLKYQTQVAENIARVTVDQWERFEQPVLVLASSRPQTRMIARIVAANLPQVEENAPPAQLAVKIHSRFPYLSSMQECLMHGVAYHNASLPDWVRGHLEEVMEERRLRAVVATTTLAEGIDLPFRVVVLADWRLFRFGQRQPMPTLLFRNIAGRCGRAWEFAEGDTIIVDKPDAEYTDYISRHEQYIGRYVNPPPYSLHSSVERALNSNDDQSLAGTRSTLESQFTAFVAACDQSEAIENDFAQSLYAGLQDDAANYVQSEMTEFTEDMISEPDFPVMERQSPLGLTDFGHVVLRTGLSPRTGIALAELIQGFTPPQEQPQGAGIRRRYGITWEPIIAAMWNRVHQEHDIQELESRDRQQIDTRGYPVRSDNFSQVAMAWVSGLPLETIAFLVLRRQRERSLILRWLSETEDGPTQGFEEDIEQVAVFCNAYLAERWSWVLRGASTIAEYMHTSELASELDSIGTRLQYGVKYLATADLLRRQRCPVDRAKLDWLVESFRLHTMAQPADVVELDRFLEWILDNDEWLKGHQFTTFARMRIDPEDIDELEQFLEAEMSRDQHDSAGR